jgi:hypothetical protein
MAAGTRGGWRRRGAIAGLEEERAVGNLHVALQDGFDNDTVEVRVNGQTVYERDGVTTLTQISLADAFDVDIDGPVDLEITLPERHVSTVVPLPERPGGAYVGVSLSGDALVHRLSEEPFGFA